MKLSMTAHVVTRMGQRGIARMHVEHALAHPVEVVLTPEGSKRYTGRLHNGREIKVWVVHPPLSDGTLIVKSAAWKD